MSTRRDFNYRQVRDALQRDEPLTLFSDRPHRIVWPVPDPDLDQLLDDPTAEAWLMGRDTTQETTT